MMPDFINTTRGDPGAQGLKGDPGAQGPVGAVGPTGPPRHLILTQRLSMLVPVAPGVHGLAIANCSTGELATGGGYRVGVDPTPTTPPLVVDSEATPGNTGWQASLFNTDSAGAAIVAVAKCTSLAP